MKLNPKEIKIPEFLMRENMDPVKIQELMDSIQKVGLINPVTVRKVEGGHELIAGYRRLHSVKELGLKTVDVKVMKVNDVDAELLKIAENLDREDVNPVEEGGYLKALMVKMGINQQQLAEVIGRSPAYVSSRIASQDWTPEIKNAVNAQEIAFTAGKILMTIRNYNSRMFYFGQLMENGAGPRLIQEWANGANEQQDRDDAANAAGETVTIRRSDTITMVKCGCCDEPGPMKEATNVVACAFCASSLKNLDVIKQFRQLKQYWIDQYAEGNPPSQDEKGEGVKP